MSEVREPERKRKRQAEPDQESDREEATERREPVGRTCAFSFVHNDLFYVGHCFCFTEEQYELFSDSGYSEDQLLPLQRFDFATAQWSGVSPVSVDRHRKGKRKRKFPASGFVCCAVVGNCAYAFGGRWRYGYAVHELNLETMAWQRLEPQNREDGPMDKKSAGMVAYGEEGLCIFGGYGPVTDRHQPGATYHTDHSSSLSTCFTNEVHLFHIKTATWSSPETTGPRPPPCADFSFTKVDLFHAVVFGGQQRHQKVNEVHILDMENWHWSGAILPTSPANRWPNERSLHCACLLFDSMRYTPSSGMTAGQRKPQLFVLWGESSNGRAIRDAWILDVDSVTWKQVKLPIAVGAARNRFSLGCYNRSPREAELLVFGGKNLELPSMVIISDDTTLLYLGMKTLYHTCVDYITGMYELFQPVLHRFIPPHIQRDISHERDRRANRAHYRVAEL